MLKKFRTYFYILAALLIISCERRALVSVNNQTMIQVKVAAQRISNVNCDIYNSHIPHPKISTEMMHVVLYDPETDRIVTETYISDTTRDASGQLIVSGYVNATPGEYDVLVYNFDTESTQVRNQNSLNTVEAYTNEVQANIRTRYKSSVNYDEAILYEPDHIIVGTELSHIIPYHEDIHVIKTQALSVVDTYYLQINVSGLEYVSSAQALMGGMSSSNLIGTNTRNVTEPAAVYFEMQKDNVNGKDVICCTFNTFGKIDGIDSDLSVTFDVTTTDGRRVEKTFDITPIFETLDAKEHHWLILDEGYELVIDPPENPGGNKVNGGGGFEPVVEDWEEEHAEICL
ncbi:MAG: DUF5119 domain-containing protein [Bacteroidaceae bacterium]|nr:DUF5119 domain-containing protein [Bacteroidaceae bacterium]